jgi:hypothetical protein
MPDLMETKSTGRVEKAEARPTGVGTARHETVRQAAINCDFR